VYHWLIELVISRAVHLVAQAQSIAIFLNKFLQIMCFSSQSSEMQWERLPSQLLLSITERVKGVKEVSV